jgi:hypothetical protein
MSAKIEHVVGQLYDLLLHSSRKTLVLDAIEKAVKLYKDKSNTSSFDHNLKFIQLARVAPLKSFMSAKSVITIGKKYWKYRRIVTSKLVPGPEVAAEVENGHILLTILTDILSHFSSEEVIRFYSLLTEVLNFLERFAVLEGWSNEQVDLTGWIPIEERNKNGRLDSSESGSDGQDRSKVLGNEKGKKAGKRKRDTRASASKSAA